MSPKPAQKKENESNDSPFRDDATSRGTSIAAL